MDQVDGHRSFAHCRRDALHAARPNLSDRKHARQARFEQFWRTGMAPYRGSGCGIQIPPRGNESLVVEGDAATQPLGSRRCSGHDEYVTDGVDGRLAGRLVQPGDPLEMRLAIESGDFSSEVYFNGGILLDALDQAARHRV